jgi:hypothetical protein
MSQIKWSLQSYINHFYYQKPLPYVGDIWADLHPTQALTLKHCLLCIPLRTMQAHAALLLTN